jgi:hypothetical protein
MTADKAVQDTSCRDYRGFGSKAYFLNRKKPILSLKIFGIA